MHSCCRSACYSVHPRVCGEREKARGRTFSSSGSSPRVRGTRERQGSQSDIQRFIPACAGNALIRYVKEWTYPVHPRVCGERYLLFAVTIAASGSSPRVRGTQRRVTQAIIDTRFIPACAGNALVRPSKLHVRSVHPRVCGERWYEQREPTGAGGSSPRVRGTRQAGPEILAQPRFIPACAGNAKRLGRGCLEYPVHPRVCGERQVGATCSVLFFGSSPRVRGTPRWRSTDVR